MIPARFERATCGLGSRDHRVSDAWPNARDARPAQSANMRISSQTKAYSTSKRDLVLRNPSLDAAPLQTLEEGELLDIGHERYGLYFDWNGT